MIHMHEYANNLENDQELGQDYFITWVCLSGTYRKNDMEKSMATANLNRV